MLPKIIGSFLVTVLAAAAVAGILAALAHTELGLSPSVIRRTALLCSGILVTLFRSVWSPEVDLANEAVRDFGPVPAVKQIAE
jgi:hypothetical protein